jgi:predicted lipid-binding transport protein (Tim44 family)
MSGARSAPRQASTKPAASRPAAPKRAARRGPGDAPLAGWRRWIWVGVLVAAVTIGLPLAHALFGEVVALLGGTLLLGVLLGRWTAPRR